MVPLLANAAWRTFKSAFGFLGLLITAFGLVGHTLAATRVSPWVCAAGLGLFALAAIWELAKALRTDEQREGELTKARDRAWHMEQARDEWQGRHADLVAQQWAVAPGTPSGPTGTTEGDVNQRAFTFVDPHQLRLPPTQEGPYRFQGFHPEREPEIDDDELPS